MVKKIVKHKDVGEELDSAEWVAEDLHELPPDSVVITSDPPSGKHRIYRIWRNEAGNLEYEYETEAAP